MIFDYKQKIQKEYIKNKELRGMARDFIFELKELKRFSDTDSTTDDFVAEFEANEAQLAESIKKKVHKCT